MCIGRWMVTGLLMLTAATAQLEPQARLPSAGGDVHPPGVGRDDTASLAPGALGTRGNTPLHTTPSTGSGYAWLQMVLALMLVAVGLRYGLPRLIRWASKTGVGSQLDGEIRLLESRAVPGGSLLMVKARDRLLLIGTTPQGMQLLADLTMPSKWHAHPEQDAQATEQPERSLSPEGFDQVLRRVASAGQRGMHPRGAVSVDLQQEVASELQACMAQAHARLSRLTEGGGQR
ncbi:MAG: flagellar biosynthetic protein FliO [Armatimonadota bacterium]